MKRTYVGLAIAGLVLTGCAKKGETGSAAAAATAPAAQERQVVREAGFSTPESVLHDTVADDYVVSNIHGSPLEKDGNGFLSRLGADGRVKKLRWVDGAAEGVELNAPKGMAIVGEQLYVADIDAVRVFERTTGKPVRSIDIPGAVFLNDVAAGEDGTVYVTDTGMRAGEKGFEPVPGTAAVHRIAPDGTVDTVIRGEELTGPNGIVVDGNTLRVVTFRGNKLLRIEDGKIAETTELPAGGLDGLVRRPDGTLYVSSWEANAVFGGQPGSIAQVAGELPSPADIGFDAKRNRVLVPLFQQNQVVFVPVPERATASGAGTATTH